MVKEIFYDLEFTKDGVLPISYSGKIFLEHFQSTNIKELYTEAIARDLRVRFETAKIRDLVV